MRIACWIVAAAFAACLGCGTGAMRATGAPDAPVPPGEPRATVALQVDLPIAQDCEEAFDLALYENRAIHLIEWDDSRGTCAGRTVRITYLSQRITRDGLLSEAGKRAARVTVVAGQ